jgi:hypothetical protein
LTRMLVVRPAGSPVTVVERRKRQLQLGPPTTQVRGVDVRSLDVLKTGKKARNNHLGERTAASPDSLCHNEEMRTAIAASLQSADLSSALNASSSSSSSSSSGAFTSEPSPLTSEPSPFPTKPAMCYDDDLAIYDDEEAAGDGEGAGGYYDEANCYDETAALAEALVASAQAASTDQEAKKKVVTKRVRKKALAALKEAENNAEEEKTAAISCVIASLALPGGQAAEQVSVLMIDDSQNSDTVLKIMVNSAMKDN